jgi:transposase
MRHAGSFDALALPKGSLSTSFPRAGATSSRPRGIEGDLVPLPKLSPEERAAALEKAAEIRKARAQLKEQLKAGKTTLTKVLDQAEADEVAGKLKVSAVLQSMPGIGKVRATQIMEKLKIAESRRLRGLGEQQRKALLAEFAIGGK